MDDRYHKLKQIRDEVLALKTSPLYQYRLKQGYYPVIGQGNHRAKLILIGEAPGAEEAKTGRPFIGQSGKILDKLLDFVHILRSDIYITNIVKDRPPGNRAPTSQEINIYSPFISRQIEIIKPDIVATLGRISMDWFWAKYGQGPLGGISQIHGQKYDLNINLNPTILVPLYHPAVALYDQSKFAAMQVDFKKLADLFLPKQITNNS